MIKKLFLLVLLVLFPLASAQAASSLPVFSANGFICGKEGITVTCKGTLPNGIGTVTGTGHDMVYLTVNIQQEGQPARYTYFSDTGCLIGYTFGPGGEPREAVASHRGGAKKNFDLSGGKFEQLVNYCTPEQGKPATAQAPATPPSGSDAKAAETPPALKPAAGETAPAPKPATPAAKTSTHSTKPTVTKTVATSKKVPVKKTP